jgi:RNA polymerase sigma-70 factor (ECF subfamily)
LTKRIETRELGRLLDQYASPLALYATQWTNAPDDCVQEAIVELAAQPVRPENPVAWLFRVVRNRALNQSRSARRRTAREKTAARPEMDSLDPAKRVQFDEEQIHLLRVLEQLPPDDRELIVLRIWSGMSWSEIAELTAISSSSAHRRYVAALEKMKLRLETPCPTKPE